MAIPNNAIKFDSLKLPGTVFKGRINLKVEEGDLGPSSNTEYYDTITPTSPTNYCLLTVPGVDPTTWGSINASGSADLISKMNDAGFGTFTTLQDCLDFVANSQTHFITTLYNVTGSNDILPYAVWNTTNGTSATDQWYNTISPRDRDEELGIENRPHALNEWVALKEATATWGAPYTGTTIYELDSNGDVLSTLVSQTNRPLYGTFNVDVGKRYVADKPIHLHVEGDGSAIAPLSYNGTEFGYYFNRNAPGILNIFNLYDQTKVLIYIDDATPYDQPDEIVSILNKHQVTNFTFDAKADISKSIYIRSTKPIVMTVSGTGGDNMIAPMAYNTIYQRANGISKGMDGSTTTGTTYARYVTGLSTNVWGLNIGDGAGNDAESSIPAFMVNQNYTWGSTLSDLHIISPHENLTVKVSSHNGTSWTTHEEITVSGGSKGNPAYVCRDGTQGWGNPCTQGSGAAANFNTDRVWLFEGSNTFALYINDRSDDEEFLLGWGSGEVLAFYA